MSNTWKHIPDVQAAAIAQATAEAGDLLEAIEEIVIGFGVSEDTEMVTAIARIVFDAESQARTRNANRTRRYNTAVAKALYSRVYGPADR